MGEVFVAQDTKLARKVALKILPPDVGDSPERRERFEREARAVAALSHPNVLAIHDFGEDQGVTFAVTELLEGKTLRERLEEGTMSPVEAVGYARQIADGLAAAHARGIVHRDLKPENLFITKDGKLKVLDFGLAKQAEEGGGEAAPTKTRATEPGTIMGTIGYMSPEQVRGQSADQRSDVFSFGVILYEMLTGERAFDGESSGVVMSAILKEDPPPLLKKKPDLPSSLEQIVDWCLKKNPDERLQTALDVGNAIDALSEETTTEQPAVEDDEPSEKKSRWKIFLAFLIVFVPAVGAIWFLQATSKVRWAREEALPEINRLAGQGEYVAAFTLAQEARIHLPDDPFVAELLDQVSVPVSFTSEPSGADVYLREYDAHDGEWKLFGTAPLDKVRVPRTVFRTRLSKEGHETVEGALDTLWLLPMGGDSNLQFVLDAAGTLPEEMARVPEAARDFFLWGWGGVDADPKPLGDYFIDKYEVTNRDFKEFVDAEGYQNRGYWKHTFMKEGKSLSWEEAMAELRDSTGRPGPADWELGDYPEGHGDYPVTGISWYEAAAYADFAGKSLPTIYHWMKAASPFGSAYILPHSNFDGRGPSAVGTYRGVSEHGIYDMAGNVREWCWNESSRGGRFLLGGGWNDELYWFNHPNIADPFDRSATNGFRCMRTASGVDKDEWSRETVYFSRRDYRKEKPVSNEVFNAYRRLYSYDKAGLESKIEAVDEGNRDWVRQKISFDAAYGGERIVAYLYLPRDRRSPLQAVVHFPGAGALRRRSVDPMPRAEMERIDFIVKSGRALMYPVYKDTYERGGGTLVDPPDESNKFKEHVIRWAKDLRRSVDYLETREDIDANRLAYYGTSWGGFWGPLMLAVEDRLKVGVLYVAGLGFQTMSPEVDVINFLPRVRVPVLMLNGRYDVLFPVETSQVPMFELLGSPAEDKRHILFEGGHFVPRHQLIQETVDWLDRYLGPVS